MADDENGEVLELTAKIVSAYIGKTQVAADALPVLIQSVHQALATVGTVPVPTVQKEPAVPIRKSVFPNYIVCLEDGTQVMMLKRYLRGRYNLTPAEYREKWGLPRDYPMVAPNYAKRRSALAKQIGLGRTRAAVELAVTAIPARRARGSKG